MDLVNYIKKACAFFVLFVFLMCFRAIFFKKDKFLGGFSMKLRSILALVLVLVMVLSIAACGKKGPDTPADTSSELAGTYNVKIWCPEAAVELTKTQVAAYNSSNKDGIVINVTVEPVGEGDAATQMVTDVEAGGDLYFFAQDQFARLVQAGALAKLGKAAAETVKSANDAGVVNAATSGTELYAYPLTSDNGYFMYYDKSVIPEDKLDSLEDLIAVCEANGKYFSFEMNTSAWYLASFFFATGCHSRWVLDNDGNYVGVDDDFDSDKGLIAVKGMQKLVKSPMHLSSSQASEFSSGAAIVVTGTWAYNDIANILGNNMGCTDLPSFTVDGTSYHLGSYNGCKLMGVKPTTDAKRQAVLHKLAQFLTSYDCQMERFSTLSWGPANLEAQKSDAVKANPGLSALFAQNQYSVAQPQIHGSWWDIAKVIGDEVKAASDEAGLKAALKNYSDKINALFSMPDEVKNAFTVIGSINGDTWSVDIPMTEVSTGVWQTAALTLEAGNEFKVRKGLSWDEAYPASNYVVEAAGSFIIQLEVATGTVTLIAQ